MVSLPHRGATKTVVFDTEIEVSARDMRGEQRICVEFSGEISRRSWTGMEQNTRERWHRSR